MSSPPDSFFAPPWQDRGGLSPGPVGTPPAVWPGDGGSPTTARDNYRMHYIQRFQGLVWAAPGIAGVASRAEWSSPVFDLRPELGRAEGIDVSACVPISRAGTLGSGGALHVVVRTPSAVDVSALIYTQESISGWDPAEMLTLHGLQDVTGDFFDGDECWLAVFEPPGAPIRFWQAMIRFDLVSGAVGYLTNIIRVGAAFY